MLADGRPVAEHYGEPLREQREFDRGRAVADLSHLGVLTVSGADRLSWIDSMTTQRIAQLTPGQSAETLLLSPQGRVEHVIAAVDDGDTLWLHTADPDGLFAFLHRMRFALRVELARSAARVYAATGGAARAFLCERPGVLAVWDDPWSAQQPGGVQYAETADHPGDRYRMTRVIVPDAIAPADLAAAGLDAAGLAAVRALEIAAWRPSAEDVDDRTLPHEFDWLRSAVHLTKGCYRGQETVAKVHNLGHPPRRVAMLHLDGSNGGVPADGALVYCEHKAVGRITRAGQHHELGAIALALLKRRAPVDVELEVREEAVDTPATQEVIVPPSAGSVRDIPKLRRL